MLKTEERNPLTAHLDKMSSSEILSRIQTENKNAVNAIDDALPQIERAVEAILPRMQKGGRLFYMGSGTSGRLGVLDAAECPPTYGVSPDTVIGIISGGYSALVRAAEGAEDSFEQGKADFLAYRPTALDTLVGISAAGGARYTLGGMEAAHSCGALVISLSSNSPTPMGDAADIEIFTDTGAEVVTGSTRMKAGSAQKMVLNMLSTTLMVRLGYVAENLMINLRPTNSKLKKRMISIVSSLTGLNESDAETRLEKAGWVIKEAIKEA